MKLLFPQSGHPKPVFPAAALFLLFLILLFGGPFTFKVRAGWNAQPTPEASPDFTHYISPVIRSEESVDKSDRLSDSETEDIPAAKQADPTRTPRPTATPPVIPPPSDPVMTNLMSLFAVLVVTVVLVGVWINRRRIL